MNSRLAIFLSFVFHPLLMPTYLISILFYGAPELAGVASLEVSSRNSLLLMLSLYTFMAPSLVIYGLYQVRIIRNMYVEDLRERRWPYLFTIIIYISATYFFGWQFTPVSLIAPQLAVILGSVTVALILTALISLRWQISAHATGIGGMAGFLLILLIRQQAASLLPPFVGTVLAGGWISAARLQLNAHTPEQVTAGLVLGFIVSLTGGYLFF